jgi:paraquat-inducible protein B
MSKQANPTLIGGFVVGALVVITVAIILFGGETFFSQRERVIMYFGGSVDGLNVGAPVNVRGVKVGTVIEIDIMFNTETGELRIPVIAEIDADSVNQARLFQADDPVRAIIEDLGMRAQLQIQSFLTSQLFIQLDYHPGTEINYYGDGSMIEVPTIPMPIEEFDKALEDLSIDQILTDIASSLSAINIIVNSPEIMETVVNMKNAFASMDKLSTELNDSLVPLAENTSSAMTDAQDTLREMKLTMENIKELTDHDSPYVEEFETVLVEIADAARTVSELQDMPQFQKLDAALNEITLAARQISTFEDSPQMTNLNTAMEELTHAARSVRILADAIERNPEILLQGKSLNE